jgi:acetyl-CoA carboxylase biotin carboxyl carrier protein
MLKMSEIRELVKLIDQSSVDELELEKEGFRLAIRKTKPQASGQPVAALPPLPLAQPAFQAAAAAPAAGASAAAADASAAGGNAASQAAAGASGAADAGKAADPKGLHTIVSPMVGTFYRAPAPDADPFVKPGDRVTEKTVVCIIEAMKLMNEIEAEMKGEIVDVLVENGQLVEYGQPLFLVKKD